MVRGRWFTDSEPAVVINESLVRRDFSGTDPMGRRIRLNDNGPPLTIVGIIQDSKYSSLDAAAEPELFVPYEHQDDALFGFTAMVRTTNDPSPLATRIRSLVSEIDGTQVPYDVMTLEQALADSIAPRRLNLVLFAHVCRSRAVPGRDRDIRRHGLRRGAARARARRQDGSRGSAGRCRGDGRPRGHELWSWPGPWPVSPVRSC